MQDTERKLTYTSTVNIAKSTCFGNTFKLKKAFLPTSLVLTIAVTFYILLTFYQQLKQASQLLQEIKEQRLVLNGSDSTLKWEEKVKSDQLKEKSKSQDEFQRSITNDKEFDNAIFDKILEMSKYQNNSEENLGQAISRQRFQENVYMIRKRFYESHQSKTKAVRDKKESDTKETQNTQKSTHDALTRKQDRPKDTQGIQKHTNDFEKFVRQEHRTDYARGNNDDPAGNTSDAHEHRPGGHVKIAIVAYMRSGSSFLGEFFNRDTKAFYLFEPMHVLDSFPDARRRFPILYDTLVRNLLDAIFKCDFAKHPLFVNTLTSSAFRLKSEALTSGKLCDPRVTSQKMHLCRRLNATLLTKMCSARPLTVIKIIRMACWENLDFLTESFGASFKVIHLVRDPRGIIASRVSWILRRVSHFGNATSPLRFAIAKYVRIISSELCEQMSKDIKDWTKRARLSRSHAIIRYEDVARNPLTVYQEISGFVGTAQSLDVIDWVKNNTKSTSDLDYYSTTRNSSTIPYKWRESLTMSLVHEIQNSCTAVMEILGYAKLNNEQELRDTSVSLVADWGSKGYLRTSPYILETM